jgi:K+-transporting ATPase KdpF subunit
MTITTAIILGICVLLAIYLTFALLKPERF